ncbi:MAG: hypothetical protein AAF192_15545 [Pseudomonadota bacterium]
MRLFFAALLALCAGGAMADLTPAAGTQTLCQGYAETHEGVWHDPSGWPMLRFRFALNPDGTTCYAWLNAVPAWNISGPGSRSGENARSEGPVRIRGETPSRGARGVQVDVDTGEAL